MFGKIEFLVKTMENVLRTCAMAVLAVLGGSSAGCGSKLLPQAYQPTFEQKRLKHVRQEDSFETIRVGSWNLYWFGSPAERDQPKVAKDLEAMARYITDSGVSVLALMELRSDPNRGSEQLASVLARVPGKWEYRVFQSNTDRGQATGIAWDTSRLRLIETIELDVERHPPGWDSFARKSGDTDSAGRPVPLHNRKVVAAYFSAGPQKTDFVVVPIHLISMLKGFHVSRVRRYYEMATILDRLAEQILLSGEQDVVLIGDTNCAADTFETFALADGTQTSASRYTRRFGDPPYFRELGGSVNQETYVYDPPGTPTGSRKAWPLDRAYVPVGQCEFLTAELVIHDDNIERYARNKTAFRASLSDHFLVYHTLRIREDDDR